MKNIYNKVLHASLKYKASILKEGDINTLRLNLVQGDKSELIIDTTGKEMTQLSNVTMDDNGDNNYNTVLITNERMDLYATLTPVLLLAHLAVMANPFVHYILNIEETLGENPVYPHPYGDDTLSIGSATLDGLSLMREREHIHPLYLEDMIALRFEYGLDDEFLVRTNWIQNIVIIECGNARVAKLFTGDLTWSVVFTILLELIPTLVRLYDNNNELDIGDDDVKRLKDEIASLLSSAQALEARGLERFGI